jgi:hypothetical protein
MVGAGMGGFEALRTGNLGKGLMAGLGGYGGAGLTGGLMGMGEAALAQGAGGMGGAVPQTMVDEFGQTVMNPAYNTAQAAVKSAGFGDKLAAGAKTFDWNNPKGFLQGLGGGSTGKGLGMLGAAFGPGVMAALEPPQYAPQQMTSDSQRAPGLVYTGGNQYRRMNDTELAQRRNLYGFAEGGLATGGMPEWNKAFNPDVPEYGDLGRDFGREVLYYSPEAAAPVQPPAATAPVLPPDASAGGYEGGAGGQDFGGGQSAPSGSWDKNSLTGGLLAALIGNQSPAPVSDMSTYSEPALQAAANAQAAYGSPEATGTSGGSPAEAGGGYDSGPGVAGVGDFGGFAGAGDAYAHGGMTGYAQGGLGSLGGYSDGGRLLRGPGDGVSDSIPATIGRSRQPARLADGEFVFPARIVSEIGNGSTAAGARKLYAMMDRIQKSRGSTVGKGRVAVDSEAHKHLLA